MGGPVPSGLRARTWIRPGLGIPIATNERGTVAGIPAGAFPRWRHRLRAGYVVDLEDPRGVPGPDNEYVLGDAIAEGVRHGGGAV